MPTIMAKPNKKTQKLPDDTSSDKEVPTRYLTTEEEHERMIPASAQATCSALLAASAQANPVVPRGFPKP